MNPILHNKLSILPEKPGCYLMKDRSGSVIYVGKANKLRQRVRSYFIGQHDGKTMKLVNEITDFEYIITSSSLEALLLEMNLIKKLSPKYNVLLKDDKGYPYLKITAERHPRLIITRRRDEDNGYYFGPYPNVQAANTVKKLLNHLYPLRECPLSSKRACLNYQLGTCIGSCVRDISEREYQEVTRKIIRFLEGEYEETKADLLKRMRNASNDFNFEKANEYLHIISCMEATVQKQKIITKDLRDRDVFGFYAERGWLCIQVLFFRKGKMDGRDTSIFQITKAPEVEFLTFLAQRYSQVNCDRPEEIVLPELNGKIELGSRLMICHPKRGLKKQQVMLACENAKAMLQERFYLMER